MGRWIKRNGKSIYLKSNEKIVKGQVQQFRPPKEKFQKGRCGFCDHIIKSKPDYYNHMKIHHTKGDLK